MREEKLQKSFSSLLKIKFYMSLFLFAAKSAPVILTISRLKELPRQLNHQHTY